MITAELYKIHHSYMTACWGANCKKLPQYIDNGAGGQSFIKKDTIFLILTLVKGFESIKSYYCRDCIDVIYRDLKPILDHKLWTLQ